MDSYKYLQHNKLAILEHWFDSFNSPSSAHLHPEESTSLYSTVLYDLIQVLKLNGAGKLNLTDWAMALHQERELSLADIIQIIFALRQALFVGLSLAEAADFQSQISPLFDQALVEMVDRFEALPQKILAQRVEEMEQVARELASTTEEAERALVQIQSLYDVSRHLSASLDLSDIMQQSVTFLKKLTYADNCALWVANETSLITQASAGLKPAIIDSLKIPLPATKSAIWRSIENSEPVIVQPADLMHSDPDRFLLEKLHASYILAIPLAVQEKAIGAITLHGNDQSLITDMALAKAIVQQTAIAMQNGALYEEVQQLNQSLEQRIAMGMEKLVQEKERLETIYQVTACLTTTLDVPQLTDQTLKLLSEVVNARDGMVMLNEDSFSIDLFCEASLNGHALHQPPTGVYAVLGRHVVRQRKGILFKDFTLEEQWDTTFAGTRSVVAAPLMADRDLQGVLLLSDPEPHRFDTGHLRLVETIATQLAATINNVKLHDYVRDQVVRLGEMLHTQEVETGQKQAILSSIADGVIASDYHGNILLVNPAAEVIVGQSSEQLIGQPVRDIFKIFDSSSRYKILSTLEDLQKKSGTPTNAVTELILESERRVINARLSVAYTSKETIGVVTVLRDITKEVDAEKAKSEFISTVSHELRTPMTSIKGYTDLLCRETIGPLTDQQSHFLNVIHRNADRLTSLINDLLDVSRIESGKVQLNLEKIRLIDLVEQVVETMLIPAQNKGLTLSMHSPPALPDVLADWDRITQVVTNLVGNSVAYTQEGRIDIELQEVASTIQVSVRDTGVGISQEDLPHIFESFYRADRYDTVVRAQSGTGLGLTIVKTFIEMHHGRIWVESQVGKGSTFSFILPVCPDDPNPNAKPQLKSDSPILIPS